MGTRGQEDKGLKAKARRQDRRTLGRTPAVTRQSPRTDSQARPGRCNDAGRVYRASRVDCAARIEESGAVNRAHFSHETMKSSSVEGRIQSANPRRESLEARKLEEDPSRYKGLESLDRYQPPQGCTSPLRRLGGYSQQRPIMTNSTTALAPLLPRRGRSPSSWRFRHDRGSAAGLEGDVHPRADVFRHARGSASSSLRAKPEPATPGTAPETLRPSSPIINDPSAVKKKDSLHHATAHAAEKTSVKSIWRGHCTGRPWQRHSANHSFDFACLRQPSKETTELRSGRRTQVATLEVLICRKKNPELEGAIPARIVHDMGSTVHLATSAPRTHEFISFSHLACNPLLRATRNRCSAPLLDVRPRGRNQDKNSHLSTRHWGNEWLAPQSLYCFKKGLFLLLQGRE
nr:unnamed protein product [Digitaria exilis]